MASSPVETDFNSPIQCLNTNTSIMFSGIIHRLVFI